MSRKAFDKIAEGLTEAIAIARRETEPARLYVPPEVDIKALREKLDLGQKQFAAAFGFTIHQVRQWEQGRVRPTRAVRAYLMLIQSNPDQVRAMLIEASRMRGKAASPASRPPASAHNRAGAAVKRGWGLTSPI